MFDQLGSAILAKPVPTAIAELVRQIELAKVARLRLGSAHTAAETLFWDIEMDQGLGTLSQKCPKTWDRAPHHEMH